MARRFSTDQGMALRSWPGRGCGLGTSRFERAPGEARGRRRLVPVADRFAARSGHDAAVLAAAAYRLTRQASR